MAIQKHLLAQGFTASSDMSAASMQFCFVELNAAGGVNLCDATTDAPIGVLQNTPTRGQTAEVCLAGISKVRVAGVDVAVGNLIGVDATGRAIALTSGTSTGFFIAGRIVSVDAADNDGALVSALISPSLARNA